MAKTPFTLGLLCLTLMAAVGCQQPNPQAAYVPPSFDPPRAVRQQVVVAPPLPTPLPPPRVAIVPPARKPAKPPAAVAVIPKGWLPPVQARPWRWIVIHHSDTETGSAAFIDVLHKARGWDGLGYDFVVGNGTLTGDGQIEVGYRWNQQSIGAHAKTPDNRFNEFGIGICLVGNMMDHAPTAKQMAAVERLTAYLMATYHIAPDHVLGHGDTKSTLCPGKYTNLPLIRYAAVRQAGGTAALAAKPYAPVAGEILVSYTPQR